MVAAVTDINYMRQSALFNPADHADLSVTVVGAGGIGATTALALAKLGVPKIKVYDFDRVDPHNQPNQMYGMTDLGKVKVKALADIVERIADKSIKVVKRKVYETTPLSGIVIGAVDSMDARRAIWHAVMRSGPKVPLYIDGRLGEQVIRVLTVRTGVKRDVKRYEATIVPNHAVAPLRCTAAGIIDVSFSVAALITRALRLAVVDPKSIQFDVFYDHRNLSFLKG